jgi:hypothetical protein
MGIQEPLALAHVLAARASAAVLVVQFVAEPGRELLHGFGEGAVVHFLDEGDDVAAFAAAEAVVGPHLWADVEGRGALVVEGAQALVGADAGGLQRHVAVNHGLDVGAGAYFVNIFAFNQTGHTTKSILPLLNVRFRAY